MTGRGGTDGRCSAGPGDAGENDRPSWAAMQTELCVLNDHTVVVPA